VRLSHAQNSKNFLHTKMSCFTVWHRRKRAVSFQLKTVICDLWENGKSYDLAICRDNWPISRVGLIYSVVHSGCQNVLPSPYMLSNVWAWRQHPFRLMVEPNSPKIHSNSGHCFDKMAFNKPKWGISKLLLCLVFGTFVENNWLILHLHHTRLFW
jgi:hypothetical protein